MLPKLQACCSIVVAILLKTSLRIAQLFRSCGDHSIEQVPLTHFPSPSICGKVISTSCFYFNKKDLQFQCFIYRTPSLRYNATFDCECLDFDLNPNKGKYVIFYSYNLHTIWHLSMNPDVCFCDSRSRQTDHVSPNPGNLFFSLAFHSSSFFFFGSYLFLFTHLYIISIWDTLHKITPEILGKPS